MQITIKNLFNESEGSDNNRIINSHGLDKVWNGSSYGIEILGE